MIKGARKFVPAEEALDALEKPGEQGAPAPEVVSKRHPRLVKPEIPTVADQRTLETAEASNDEEIKERLEQLKREVARLKEEMEEAERLYLTKKKENEGFLKEFKLRFNIGGENLGQSGKEEEGLKMKYNGKKREYEEILAELEALRKDLPASSLGGIGKDETGEERMLEQVMEVPLETESAPVAEVANVETSTIETPATPEIPEGGTGEYAMDPETSVRINNMEAELDKKTIELKEELKKIKSQLDELDAKILKASSGQSEGVDIQSDSQGPLHKLTEAKKKLEIDRLGKINSHENLIYEIQKLYFSTLGKSICGAKENFDKIAKMRAWDVLDNRKTGAHKFLERVMNLEGKNAAKLQNEISPKQEESFRQWAFRISEAIMLFEIKKI